MKQIALIFALLSGMAVAQPGPADLIANIPGRTTVSLDGTWNAIVDPYETGLRAKFYENVKAKDKSDLVAYNFDTAGTLKVPGDWNTQRESPMFYENPVWYQRYFSYHKRAKTRLLNGKLIFLRGISMHEEAPFRDGRAYSEEDGNTLLGWAKELGGNFIRRTHYQHNETFIRLADQKGILLWSGGSGLLAHCVG